jgi:hypothetical protein
MAKRRPQPGKTEATASGLTGGQAPPATPGRLPPPGGADSPAPLLGRRRAVEIRDAAWDVGVLCHEGPRAAWACSRRATSGAIWRRWAFQELALRLAAGPQAGYDVEHSTVE